MTLRWSSIGPGTRLHAVRVDGLRSGHPVERHDHDFAEAFLVLEGVGVHRLDGGDEPLAPGDVRLIPPETRHGFAGRMRFVNVAFPASLLSVPWGGGGRRADARPVFEAALRAHGRSDPGPALRFVGSLLTLLAEPPPVSGPPWLVSAAAGLAGDAGLRAGVPGLVARAGVAPATLSRAVRAERGETPTEWVNGLRLLRAAELLRATDLPVSAVAARVGWTNLSGFHRAFRARFGATPGCWRSGGSVV